MICSRVPLPLTKSARSSDISAAYFSSILATIIFSRILLARLRRLMVQQLEHPFRFPFFGRGMKTPWHQSTGHLLFFHISLTVSTAILRLLLQWLSKFQLGFHLLLHLMTFQEFLELLSVGSGSISSAVVGAAAIFIESLYKSSQYSAHLPMRSVASERVFPSLLLMASSCGALFLVISFTSQLISLAFFLFLSSSSHFHLV